MNKARAKKLRRGLRLRVPPPRVEIPDTQMSRAQRKTATRRMVQEALSSL